MGRPMRGEYVQVVDNSTMRIVGKGVLVNFTRNIIEIRLTQSVVRKGFSSKKVCKQYFDARTHHFLGYEPPVMLVVKDGKLVKKSINE